MNFPVYMCFFPARPLGSEIANNYVVSQIIIFLQHGCYPFSVIEFESQRTQQSAFPTTLPFVSRKVVEAFDLFVLIIVLANRTPFDCRFTVYKIIYLHLHLNTYYQKCLTFSSRSFVYSFLAFLVNSLGSVRKI